MNIITEKGERITIDYDAEFCYEKAALVDDDVHLKDVWIVELNIVKGRSTRNFEMEWYKDIKMYHEPTEDEILQIMVVHGMNIYSDIAIVRHGYEIDRDYD